MRDPAASLRLVRDRCARALLDALATPGESGSPATLRHVPEALAVCGHLAEAHRALDRILSRLDRGADAFTLAAVAVGALRLGRGEALIRVRAREADEGGDPLRALIRAGRVARAAGDREGVTATLDALADAGADALLAAGVEGEALALAASARTFVDDPHRAAALGAALTRLADPLPEGDPRRLAALARGLAWWCRGGSHAESLALAGRAAQALLDALPADGRVGPRDAWIDDTACVALDAQEALAGLDGASLDAEPLRVVLCNAPPADADRIAEALVRERLAACVNIVPAVRSVYEWKGEVERETESAMLIKTVASRVDALTARLVALHPYELPEVIALPVGEGEGNPAYHAWVAAQTRA